MFQTEDKQNGNVICIMPYFSLLVVYNSGKNNIVVIFVLEMAMQLWMNVHCLRNMLLSLGLAQRYTQNIFHLEECLSLDEQCNNHIIRNINCILVTTVIGLLLQVEMRCVGKYNGS